MPEPKRIGLALQGGGAHSAFTWGVLDRLLEEIAEGRIEIAAISATSGGAVNGAAFVVGLIQGGAQRARALLREVWEKNAELAQAYGNPLVMASLALGLQQSPTDRVLREGGKWNFDEHPSTTLLDLWSRQVSPYQFDAEPVFGNALDQLIAATMPSLNRELKASKSGPELFVCATNVKDNSRKIFNHTEIDPAAIRASACLPFTFKAVEVGDDAYWDGGYIANPALQPLFDKAFYDEKWIRPEKPDDIVVVRVNPFTRKKDMPPRTAHQIIARLNEITFNSSIILEANSIEAINNIVDKVGDARNRLPGFDYRHIRLHAIRNDEYMEQIGVASKQNPYRPFLEDLFNVGRHTADGWLRQNGEALGKRGTWDIAGHIKSRLKSSMAGLD